MTDHMTKPNSLEVRWQEAKDAREAAYIAVEQAQAKAYVARAKVRARAHAEWTDADPSGPDDTGEILALCLTALRDARDDLRAAKDAVAAADLALRNRSFRPGDPEFELRQIN